MNKNVLLHACCATCSSYPIEKLIEDEYQPVLYYFNPNIHPVEEYEKRLNELINYSKKKGIELIIEEYIPEEWHQYISGLENEPEKGERCARCFEYRLIKTAQKAIELGFSNFTTTLTVSPHKQSKVIFQKAKEIEEKYKIKFLEYDFKKNDGFLKTMKIAKEQGFYRQNYCGCIYSKH